MKGEESEEEEEERGGALSQSVSPGGGEQGSHPPQDTRGPALSRLLSLWSLPSSLSQSEDQARPEGEGRRPRIGSRGGRPGAESRSQASGGRQATAGRAGRVRSASQGGRVTGRPFLLQSPGPVGCFRPQCTDKAQCYRAWDSNPKSVQPGTSILEPLGMQGSEQGIPPPHPTHTVPAQPQADRRGGRQGAGDALERRSQLPSAVVSSHLCSPGLYLWLVLACLSGFPDRGSGLKKQTESESPIDHSHMVGL